MRKRPVKYRVEINYLSRPYEDRALSVSSPVYNLKQGWKEYRDGIRQKCSDNPNVPARVHFWKYHYTENGEFAPVTIAKNY